MTRISKEQLRGAAKVDEKVNKRTSRACDRCRLKKAKVVLHLLDMFLVIIINIVVRRRSEMLHLRDKR